MVLDAGSVRGQLGGLGFAEHGAFALIGRHRPLLGALLGVYGHHGFLGDFVGQDRAVRRTHHDVVGVDGSAHHGLPEPPGGATTVSSRRPLLGLAVNMTPADSASTICWTTTARLTVAGSMP